MKAVKIIVSGKVQGVFYRHTAQQQALVLGINGIIKNESNGSVYIEAEGDETALNQFIDWARIGSPASQVQNVQVEESRLQGYEDFTIS